jgi:hypothetical protein
LYNLNKICVSLKLPNRSHHMCFSIDNTFVMVLDSPWQLRYTELKWCMHPCMQAESPALIREQSACWRWEDLLTTLRKDYEQNAFPLKVHLGGMWSFVNYDEDIRNLITRGNLDSKIHAGLAFSRHRKTLSFWWIGGSISSSLT